MIHRVAMCRCAHEAHPDGPCSHCGCQKSMRRDSPVTSHNLSSDDLNEMRRLAKTCEVAALIITKQAKAIEAALGRRRAPIVVPREEPAKMNGHARVADAGPALVNRGLTKCERALLTVLSQRRDMHTTKAQLGILAGYSVKSSGFQNALGSLRTAGLVRDLRITGAGVACVGAVEPPKGKAEVLAYWKSKLGRCERAILDAVDAIGQPSKDQIAATTGYSERSSGFQNALGRLRTLELVRGRDPIELGQAFE